MNPRYLLTSTILMYAVCTLTAQTGYSEREINKHLSVEDSLFYESLSDSIYPPRSNVTGDTRQNPIQAGSYSGSFHYNNTQNTSSFTNQYGRYTRDVFYRLVLTVPMNVTFTHQGSVVPDTYMYLLDSYGNLIESNDNYDGEGHCTMIGNSFIRRQLAAGTYYVVSECYSGNGKITTNITGFASTDYGYTSIPSAYSTEPDNAVGAMGGTFSVSATGGATYSIPVEVPLGVNGLQPQLSIVYNSQAGNGLCGYGTNLSGLSSITRGPKDIYHDGMTRGIRYQADDALYLDGVRLILYSGTPGQDGATYKPESDPFTSVITRGTYTMTNDNTWFEVHSSDGMTYKYGYNDSTSLSYTDFGNAHKIHSWYLGYVQQPTGNYMEYTYEKDNNCIYPIRIRYGAHVSQGVTTAPHFNAIEFTYQSRPDTIPIRFDGMQGRMNKRLRTITSKTNGTVFRSFKLDYAEADGTVQKYSRLAFVTKRNKDNESIPPIQLYWSYLPYFEYTSADMSVSAPNVNQSFTMSDQMFISGDINNDGISDIIGMQSVNVTNGNVPTYHTYVYVYNSQMSSDGTVSFPNGTLHDLGTSGVLNSSYYNLWGSPSTIDFDGDGLREILVPYFNRVQDENQVGFLLITQNGLYIFMSYDLTSYHLNMPRFTAGDLDNDGKDEIIYAESVGGNVGNVRYHIIKHNPNSYGTGHIHINFVSPNGVYPERLYVDDMNGDGVNDIVASNYYGFTIYWNQGGQDLNYSFAEQYNSSHTDMYDMQELFYKGDFNGDGLTDFLTNSGESWYFFLNNGNGTFNKCNAGSINGISYQYFTSLDVDKFHCDIVDFDRDGKSDVIVTKASYSMFDTFDKTHTYWLRSTGTTLQQVYHATSNKADDALMRRFVTGDFDGDGFIELANYGYDCVNGDNEYVDPSWHINKYIDITSQSGKVTYIEGNYGCTTEITYSTLANQDVYTQGTSDLYPAPRYTIPLNIVKQTFQENGAAGSFTTNYNYSGLKIHLQGKGVLGFCSTTAENITQGTSITSSVTGWNGTFFIPNSTKVKVTAGLDSTVTTNNIVVVNKGAKKYFAYSSQTVSKDFDGRTTTTVYSYDTLYGYPLMEKVTYKYNMYRSVSYSDYILAGGAYRPQTIISTQRHSDDNSSFSRTTKYIYDSTTGLVSNQVENYGTSKPVTTNYTYDVIGNIICKNTTTNDITSLATYYEYDYSRRFPVRIYTNPISDVYKYTYDTWGNILTEQDSINNSITNTITNTYDGWGNLIRTQTPGYGEVTYTRGWNNSSDKRYFILSQGTSRPWVKTWYDNQGREVMVESVGVRDITLSIATNYNPKGLKSSITETTGNLTVESDYSYDSRGRLTTETRTGNSITYQYGINSTGRTVTVNDNGRQTVYTYDAMGNLKQVQGPITSNKVTYNYSSNGGIKSAVAAGSTWTFGYDNRGNRTSMNDPDAGETIYTYDAFGRETGRTDARGVVFSTNYDYLGRVTSTSASRSGNTETVTYQYGTSGTGQSRLTGKTLGNFISSYEYDQYGRLTMESNGVHSVSYQYSASGLVSRMTWDPNNSTDRYVDYTYDSYGNCIGQSAISGAMVWNLTGYTGTNSTSTMSLQSNPNPFTRTTTYDSNGNLSSSTLVRNSTTLSSASYTFNAATGNLTSRTLGGNTQTFTYDNLDRLTEISSNNQSIMSMTYSANGNISSKTGIGDYEYYSYTQPHAVTSVSNTSNLITTDAQSVTYNIWGKVSEVNVTSGSDTYKYELTYGPDLQRVLAVLWKNNQLVHLVTYGRNYEEKYLTSHITRYYYMNGSDGSSAVFADDTDDPDVAYCIDKDHLGSVIGLYDKYGDKCYGASFDAWGLRTVESGSIEYDRGFTGHEHIDEIGLIDMNGRVYDPYIGRFLSPDAFVQAPENPQNYNRYSYCLNNPLKYTDPDGELFWEAVLIGAAIFGTGNTVAHAIRGDINDFGDGLKYFAQGALAGAALGATWYIAPSIPWIGDAIQSYMTLSFQCKIGMTIVSAVSGIARGIVEKNWDGLWNSAKMFLGNFYLDENSGFLEGVWQGYSRHSWESLQTGVGHSYNQARNIAWKVDRVDYMAGATYATDEYSTGGGMSLGNFIKIKIFNEIDSDFETWVLSNPEYMHEYGHILDSRRYGPAYLFAIGVPSLWSAYLSQPKKNEPEGVSSHSFYWTEIRANVNAKKYFEDNYGVSWSQHYKKNLNQSDVFTIETFYPTIKR